LTSFGPDFRPLPFFLGNPHVQTVLGALLPGRVCPRPQRRYVLGLGDGDSLLVYENRPRTWRPGLPVALLVHGLTGCHRSNHVRRMAAALLDRGVRVFRVDLRGAGDGIAFARGTYHAGRSEDLRAVLAALHSAAPASPLWLIGVSLGGNVSLKLAGELSEHPVANLARVAALNPPIDLPRCCVLLEKPHNRFYERRFLNELLAAALRRRKFFPDLPPVNLPRTLTLRQFDDLYTAALCGFAGVEDYYRRASSFPYVPRIPIPTLILTSRDDPFVAVEPFEELSPPAHVVVQIAERGGHVGYVGLDFARGLRWAERRLVDWLCEGYDHRCKESA
jgi:predicted alpha/beta-fold hydrolase